MIGHRETSERVYPALEKTVRSLAEKGVKEFFVGQYGSFDALAAHAVKQVKKTHADTKWIYCLPTVHLEDPIAFLRDLTRVFTHLFWNLFPAALQSCGPISG